jgi:hypothetical protein
MDHSRVSAGRRVAGVVLHANAEGEVKRRRGRDSHARGHLRLEGCEVAATSMEGRGRNREGTDEDGGDEGKSEHYDFSRRDRSSKVEDGEVDQKD